MIGSFEVFLSFKNSDAQGNQTPEAKMAEELFECISGKGVRVFYCNHSIEMLGAAQYKAAIDSALDEAKVLIAIGSSAENLNASWVRYEWDGFYGDILSGIKQGQVISYIDNISAEELPRTLRQLKCFEKNKCTCEDVAGFVINALRHNESVSGGQTQTMPRSLYSFLDDKEKERLMSQALLVADNDIKLLSEYMQSMPSKLNVLDLGCSNGFLTQKIFSNFEDRIEHVIGLDYQQSCIDDATSTIHSSLYSFYSLDLESSSWTQDLEALMQRHQIQKFDVIFSALMFHHLRQPEKVLKKVRKYLSDTGILYIRTCDDDEIEGYPDENMIIKNTLLSTYHIAGISDRTHGKKLFGQLYRSGYNHVEMKNYYVTTTQMNVEEKLLLFFGIFYWRKNQLKKQLNLNPSNTEYLNEYNDYCEKMEEIEDMFYSPDFYFRVAGPIAIAHKI